MNMKMSVLLNRLWVALLLGGGLSALQGAEKVDFEKDIRVILESACLNCHNVNKVKGQLRLETRALAIQGGENGPVLVPGKPEESPLYTATTLPPDNEHAMPPKEPPLTKLQTEQLRQWIQDGAVWPENVTLQPIRRILFVQDIQPILETSCLSCHREGENKGKLRLETRETAFKGGENGPVLVPGHPEKSALYTATVLDPSHENLMPPKDKGGPLRKEQTELLREWIRQGASWPDNWALKPRAAEIAKRVDEALLVAEIHKRIQEGQTVTSAAEMRPYTNTIPGTSVRYAMIPIPPGEFRMGSPDSEPGRKPDEGPLHQVKVDAFWMGRCEVTWNEFELFMYPSTELKKKLAEGITLTGTNTPDAVARPSAPYVDLSFGMGKERYPAISMTQHAANKYCEWLSAKTGHFYRLPTEAEWEYACRAGTTTAYSFGDDPPSWANMPGMVTTATGNTRRSAPKSPTPGASMTCMATWPNGASTNTTPIFIRNSPRRRGQSLEQSHPTLSPCRPRRFLGR